MTEHDAKAVEELASRWLNRWLRGDKTWREFLGEVASEVLSREAAMRERHEAATKGLVEALEEMRWVQPTYNGSPSCAYCGQQQHLHTKPCGVDAVLASYRAAQQPEPPTLAPRDALTIEAFDCPECGLTRADEDGCCVTCGRDCTVITAVLSRPRKGVGR